jgi:hypothetical protein
MRNTALFFPFLVFIELENIQYDKNNGSSEEEHLEKLDHAACILVA